MGDEACIIQLDSMRDIYIMTLPNLKTARDKCSLPIRNQDKAEFKIGDMVLHSSPNVSTF